jgi:hypothetical protein
MNVHLQRKFVRRIECGTTGPVRVTEKLSETTCQACRTADERRRHLNNCDVDGCATCIDLGLFATQPTEGTVTTIAPDTCETGIDVVYLLTDNPDHVFTLDQIDAVHDAEHLGFISISITGDQRPTLAPNISYCATCLVGCEHETGQPTSCEHAMCFGSEATHDCPGRTFDRLATPLMTGHDWQLAEIRLNAVVAAR